MSCKNCKKSGIGINCRYCIGEYCSRCIQPEIHSCPGLGEKKANELLTLQKNLQFVKAKQIKE